MAVNAHQKLHRRQKAAAAATIATPAPSLPIRAPDPIEPPQPPMKSIEERRTEILSKRAASSAKVMWSDIEREAVIKRTAELRDEEPELTLTQLAELAQDVLPEYRRRKILNYKFIHPNFKQKLMLQQAVMRKQRVEEAVKSVPPEVITIPVNVEAPPLDKAAVVHQCDTPTLIAELFSRLFTRLDRLEQALSQGESKNGHPPAPALRIPTAPAPARRIIPSKPTVAVVGLFRDQFEHVVEKLSGQDVELVFVDKDDSAPKFKQNMDAIIVQHHTRHKWFDSAQKTVGNDRVFFADGGITSVVQKVMDFLSRRNSQRMSQLVPASLAL